MSHQKCHFLIGTRWFGVLGPTQLMIDALVEQGYRVYVFGQKDDHYARYYDDNCTLIEINMARSYSAFWRDFKDIVRLAYYVRKYKPEGIHSFNPKPALLSWVASTVSPKTKFFIGVTGLGNTFIRAKSMEPLITRALRAACNRASYVFFQNNDDVELFTEKNIVKPEKIKKFIGPGVDLRIFKPAPKTERGDDIIVSCTARLIWQKGIREYIEAARIVKENYAGKRNITFKLYGEVDTQHPDVVDAAFVATAHDEGTIEHISWTDDIVHEIQQSDIFVLHSYREGAPRAILEASACHVPTVGADAIGVRELVQDGVTGYLTPLTEVQPIVDAISKLIDDPDLRKKMGDAARKRIAEPFSLVNSSDAQMEMYRAVGYKIPHLAEEV